MSEGELMVLLLSGIGAILAWIRWYRSLLNVKRLGAPAHGRALLVATPPFCAAALCSVLVALSSADVRADPKYLALYFLMGAAWVGGATHAAALLGLSALDDVAERGNGAAAIAIAGGVVGATFCFAGGNIGDGPGWWVVVFSAGLATAGLFFGWLVLEFLTCVSDTVTIDRDRAAGLRLGGFLAASGLVLGRAVAGDWVSIETTMHDFVSVSWPLGGLIAIAVVFERAARPTPARPVPPVQALGAMPATAYLAAAVVYVAHLGVPL